ncbi:MAG: PHA/PHB synthase family protein, partial [Comamonas sp.]
MNQQAFWGAGNEQMMQMLSNGWAQALKAFQNVPGAPAGTAADIPAPVAFDQDRLRELQQQYLQEAMELWKQSSQGVVGGIKDKRFAAAAWQQNPLAAFSAASYVLNARTMMGLADAVVGDEKTRARILFGVEQWMAAMAPSNFLAFNAEAQQKAIDTKGQSLAQGMQNLLNDLRQGHVSMTDESKFEVGKNVATTEGAVVYENELFQLIEYKPLTAQVYERPLLFVPPCINKFYILDLQPDNSLIRYAVSEGHRTFVVSWRNPDEGLGNQTWDDYIENAVIRAIEVAKEISGQPQINTLGFCVGGTMLVNALGVLAARGDDSVASTTLLTTLVDFSDTGVLDVFIDEAFVRFREMSIGKGGLMRGQELAS